MLQVQPQNRFGVSRSRDVAEGIFGPAIDLDLVLAAVRRQWIAAVLVALAGLAAGCLHILTAVPLYTARTSVLIDRQNRAITDQLAVLGGILDDEATVLSQVELLKSDTISLAVVDRLQLGEDPAFTASGGSLFAALRTGLSKWLAAEAGPAGEIEARRRTASDRVQAGMEVSRTGRTYVLEIAYTSPSPELSGRVAAAIAEAYLADKRDSQYEATRSAGAWLQERLADLREKSLETDLAVQKFRTANGLVSTGDRLVTDQQLAELNSALIAAQADTAKAHANLARIRDIIAAGRTDAIVTEVLDSSVSNRLRERYLEASKREAEITARAGPDHALAVRLRAEMREYQRLMFEEIGRIAESYESDLDVARSRETRLMESVTQASEVSASANETKVLLRELEREAETYRNLYQTFLQRYQEALQQQSFPVAEARIISRATVPDIASHPRTTRVLLLSLMFGCAAGVGFGAFREFRDRSFRTGEQVRDALGLDFLGSTPMVDATRLRSAEEVEADGIHPRLIRKPSAIANYVVDHPLSAFAETMRSARIAADQNLPKGQSRVIGIVSVLPGEGKSVVAVNFAELLASQGARTILVDADLRNPAATRTLARHAESGLVEAALEGRCLKDLFLFNRRTKLAFLPAGVRDGASRSSELLASEGMDRVLAAAAQSFDYVVLDLPPVEPVVDARAVAGKVDGFIFVVEWGKTARKMVLQALAAEPLIAEKCLGVILSKVDVDRMRFYRAYRSSEYYYSRYSSYYSDN